MNKKINLLVVTDEMEVGGTQRQITYLLSNLDKQKFNCTVIYFQNESFLVDELINSGVTVIKIPRSGKFDIRFVMKLYQAIKTGHFDVIHAVSFSGEFWATLIGKLAGVKTVITSARAKYEWYSPLQWRIKRWTASASAWVLSNSQAGADYAIEKTRLSEDHFQVVYNGVPVPDKMDAQQKLALKRELGIPLDATVIGFAARIVEQKNVHCLLRAVERIPSEHNIVVVIAGNGDQFESMQETIAKGQQDRFITLGERNDIDRLMQIFDILALPSRWEGLSNTILESMISGIPVVASTVGGNAELVDQGNTGLLFPNDDDLALAESLIKMLEAPADRITMGTTALAKAEKMFTVSAMVERMESIYNDCFIKNGKTR